MKKAARHIVLAFAISITAFSLAPAAIAGQAADDSGGGGGGGGASDSTTTGISAAVLACMKAALTPADFTIAQQNRDALSGAARTKALNCFNTNGATSSVTVVKKGAWLVANPVDLAHITAISQFRSCAGHDFSGQDVNGQTEADRSMKHYIVTNAGWSDAAAIRGFAPFDGTVQLTKEQSGIGQQMKIYNAKSGWSFVFFHTTPTVANGANVKAGQLVTTWPGEHTAAQIQNATPDVSFDFALKAANGMLDSPFLHMAPKVARQWAAKGFTAESLILSKATRDATPCNGTWSDKPGGSGYVLAR